MLINAPRPRVHAVTMLGAALGTSVQYDIPVSHVCVVSDFRMQHHVVVDV